MLLIWFELFFHTLFTCGSTIKYKNWTNYVNGSPFKSLDQLDQNDFTTMNVKYTWQYLLLNSLEFFNLQNKNFSHFSNVKSIIGRVHCCSGFPIYKQMNSIYFSQTFYFRTHAFLKMKVTFLEINLIISKFNIFASEYLHIYNGFQYDCNIRGKYLLGKRNIFDLFSTVRNLLFRSNVIPSLQTKYKLFFTVIDSSLITIFHCSSKKKEKKEVENPLYFPFKYQYYAILHQTIHLKSFHIVVDKLLRVKIKVQNSLMKEIELHDGPDDRTKVIKQIGNQIIMSTFQCYLKIYGNDAKNLSSGIRITTVKQEILYNITINSSFTFSSDMCRKADPLHCIVFFNARNMYLNMSLINMTFSGPNTKRCAYGGLSYHGVKVKKYLATLCDNYTQTPEYNSFDKVPMNYVSTESYLLLILYGYHPYNKDMDVNIEIALTPCRGIICLDDQTCKYM